MLKPTNQLSWDHVNRFWSSRSQYIGHRGHPTRLNSKHKTETQWNSNKLLSHILIQESCLDLQTLYFPLCRRLPPSLSGCCLQLLSGSTMSHTARYFNLQRSTASTQVRDAQYHMRRGPTDIYHEVVGNTPALANTYAAPSLFSNPLWSDLCSQLSVWFFKWDMRLHKSSRTWHSFCSHTHQHEDPAEWQVYRV